MSGADNESHNLRPNTLFCGPTAALAVLFLPRPRQSCKHVGSLLIDSWQLSFNGDFQVRDFSRRESFRKGPESPKLNEATLSVCLGEHLWAPLFAHPLLHRQPARRRFWHKKLLFAEFRRVSTGFSKGNTDADAVKMRRIIYLAGLAFLRGISTKYMVIHRK